MTLLRFTLLLSATLTLLPTQAAPASWWRWESQVDGRLVCSQVSPGQHWKRFSGPYTNAACREP